jgi:hypothetical protein
MSNDQNAITLSPKQVSRLLAKTVPANEPVLLVGKPGVAKTSVVKQTAEALGYDLVISHPPVENPTDSKGFAWPVPEEGRARFLLAGQLEKIVHATKNTIWFLDDFGQATPQVQAPYMQWILARECAGHKLPDCVSIVSATNRRGDRAGVQGLLETVKSRFTTIVEMDVTKDDFTEWAFKPENNINPIVIAFIGFKPNLLSDFQPTADMTNSPSPRAWEKVSRLLNLDLPRDTELAAMRGTIGQGAAGEFVAFQRVWREMPNIDAILMDPDTAKIPTDVSVLHAVCTALASKATPKNIQRIIRFSQRLYDKAQGEFATLAILSSWRKDAAVATTPDWAKLAVSPLGKMILGTDNDK